MVDLIDNKEEVLGIFHRCPEKLMIMPGLEVGWVKEPNANRFDSNLHQSICKHL